MVGMEEAGAFGGGAGFAREQITMLGLSTLTLTLD